MQAINNLAKKNASFCRNDILYTMCCAFLNNFSNYEINAENSEKHEDYSPEKKIAINLIAELGNEIIDTLPEKVIIVNACREIASHWHEVRMASEAVPTKKRSQIDTMLPADRAKVMFSQIWNSHFTKIVNSRSGAMGVVGAGLKAMESLFVNGKAKAVEFFNIMLDLEEKKSRGNEKAGQNTIARLGGVHFLETDEIPETSEGLEMTPTHVLQIALAQQFIEYLYIQKDFAGLTPFPTSLPDPEYTKRTRNNSRAMLEHIKTKGWSGIVNPELVDYLNKNILLPEDLSSVSKIGTHDLNLSKDQKGRDQLIDAKIGIGIDEKIEIENFDTQIISPDGNGYLLIPFLTFLKGNQNDLSQYFDPNNKNIVWNNFPKLIDINELPRTHFVISQSKNTSDASNQTVLSHRANHGFARRHLHLVGRKIQQYTGHFRQDGQEASNDLDHTAKVLKSIFNGENNESITTYPNYPSTNEIDTPTREQQQIESQIGISDVAFNFNFDQKKMSQNVRIVNKHLVNPDREKVDTIINSVRGKVAIENLLRGVDDINEDQVINELQDIINPRINRQMLLNLVLKQGRNISTASCIFPAQSYGRVSLAITPNCSELILNAYDNQTTPLDEDTLIEIKRILKLFTTEHALAYLGLPPLGYLGVYTHRSKIPAQTSAEMLTKDANDLAAIDLIVSDLKYSDGIKEFHSAQSQYDENTFGAIGIVNGRLSARLNLTKKSLLNRFLNRKKVEELGILPTLELKNKSLIPSFLERNINTVDIATLGSFIANLYRYPTITIRTLYGGMLADYPKFLEPDGVNIPDILPILARTILAATYKTMQERRDQWENLSENLALSLGYDYSSSSS